MKLGVVGLPNVGKSTLFNAVTRAGAEAANYPFCTIEPNAGVAFVPDARLEGLGRMYYPRKMVPAIVEFVDIAGLVKGASRGEGLGNKFLSHIREVDAIVHVVRCFEDENIVHIAGRVDPIDDIVTVNLELILADLDTVQRRGERARKMFKTGERRYVLEAETADLLAAHLEAEQPARTCGLSEEQREIVRGWFLLTVKPVLYALNIAEPMAGRPPGEVPGVAEIQARAEREGAQVLVISARVEAEIAELEPEDKAAFLADLGIKRSGLERLIEAGYALLGLISFLTIGDDEVRAWTIRRGTRAPQAAGKVHTDFERGFIRAEVVPYDTLTEKGGMSACRELGLIRSEGREYVMKDGDVALFRFNV